MRDAIALLLDKGLMLEQPARESIAAEVYRLRSACEAALNWYTPPNDSKPFPVKQITEALGK